MGEGNARTLRGAEMEDVTFASTATRPGLQQAEVALMLDGDSFPVPFADLAAVQVARRIERGAGSVHQVSGREARVRDVQALFADLAGSARFRTEQALQVAHATAKESEAAMAGLRAELAGAAQRELALIEAAQVEAEAKLRPAPAPPKEPKPVRWWLDYRRALRP